MLKAVRRLIVEKGMIRPGDAVLAAVSGGPDSMALLRLLVDLRNELSFSLGAAHLDHAARPESAADALFVRRECEQLDVTCHAERIDVPRLAASEKLGFEEAARNARREFLLRVAARQRYEVIALGHHRGDQAETVLHRLLRGSGQAGLCGMRLVSRPFVRPLLPFSREQILAYLKKIGQSYRDDLSNLDAAFTRNRIRHELLPLMASFNPKVEESLWRWSGLLDREEDFWREEVARYLAEFGRVDDGLWLDRPALLALHPALRSRVLRGALAQVRGHLQGITARHVEAIEALSDGMRPQAEVDLPGVWVGRRYERLWFRLSPPGGAGCWSIEIPAPGLYLLPDGDELVVEVGMAAGRETRWSVEFAAELLPPFPWTVRNRRPGDCFRPSGGAGSKKLKDFFIDAKCSREARQRQPLVLAGGQLLWVVGWRRCAGFHPLPEREPSVRLTLRGR